MNTRTITLNLTDNDIEEITGFVGQDNFQAAIGYLSTWNTAYPYVQIYRDGKDIDLVATYRDVEGDRSYVLGAVWHDDHYGFHS
jgi:hypothetical protein